MPTDFRGFWNKLSGQITAKLTEALEHEVSCPRSCSSELAVFPSLDVKLHSLPYLWDFEPFEL